MYTDDPAFFAKYPSMDGNYFSPVLKVGKSDHMPDHEKSETHYYDPSARASLDEAICPDILQKVLLYAIYQCKKYFWMTNAALDPHDLVQEAIALAYGVGADGGYRNWDREKYPDLAIFLMTVIKSIVSHKIEHLRNFPKDPVEGQDEVNVDFTASAEPSAKDQFASLSRISAEDRLIQADSLSNLVRRLESMAEGDEEMEIVVMCLQDGISKPREISEQTSYDIGRVNNILKRLRRKARGINIKS